MSDRLRMTGMYSGMDTESIIQQLVSVKQTKVTNLQNEQKKLEWKQTAWQDLNSKIYSLYSKTLSNLRLSSAYKSKTTKSSDTTKATVLASDGAVNGTQTLKINQLAKSGYLTGAEIKKSDGSDITSSDKLSDITGVSGGTVTITVGKGDDAKTTDIDVSDLTVSQFVSKLKDAGVSASFDEANQRFFISSTSTGSASEFIINDNSGNNSILTALGINDDNVMSGTSMTSTDTYEDNGVTKTKSLLGTETLSSVSGAGDLIGKTIQLTVGGKTTDIAITADTTINDLTASFKEAGLSAQFNISNQSFDLSSKESFSFSLKNDDGTDADNSYLAAIGLGGLESTKASDCTRVQAQDAEIVLNGATFTSATNGFTINGLTINVTGVTDDEITLTTETDYDGIYNTIKDFLSEYNELINEMDKLYNADSARKYSMLTDDEKESMTDDEIEAWEDTIKGALLRKDTTLNSVMSSMTNLMMGGFLTSSLTDDEKANMTSGEIAAWEKQHTKYLFDYGISTLSYFTAEDNEHHAYHIDGDPDDENTSTNTDKLKAAIVADPEGTAEFFANLCKSMYDKLGKLMASTDYSSIYKVYNDKQLQSDYDDYTTKISDAEDELSDYEDKWYDKFGAMETALSKLQSNSSVVSSMLGTS